MAALCLTVNAGDPPLGKGRAAVTAAAAAAAVRGLHQPSGAGQVQRRSRRGETLVPGRAWPRLAPASVHAGRRLP